MRRKYGKIFLTQIADVVTGVVMSSIIWLGKGREKAILNLCNQHVEKIVESVRWMRENIYAFCGEDKKKFEASFKEVARREGEADEIKEKILEDLSKGMFHPINRDEIMRLVLTADDIAANAQSTTRRLKFISPHELDNKTRNVLRELSDTLFDQVKFLSEAFTVLSKKPEEAMRLAKEVEEMEEKIDDFRMEAVMPAAIACCERSKKTWFCLTLRDVIEHMETIADRCEDVADVIRGIAISHA